MSLLVDITKEYPGFRLRVQFEAKHEILALLGASGCGKSMTLQCIAGIIKPDAGRIVLDGEVVFDSAKRINLSPQERRVGLLFQNYALFPNMTVAQNILAGMQRDHKAKSSNAGIRRNHNGNDMDARLQALLHRFYLYDQRNHFPAQLSGGQQQRAALARIFASEPRLIMLDEPLSALDSYLRWQLEQELMETLETYPGTVIYVSHNRDEVYRMAKRVCIIQDGASAPTTSVRELFDAPCTLPAAILSGCKNYSRAEVTGPETVYAKDWGCSIDCGREVPANTAYIGVRAHYFSPGGGENTLQCTVERVIDDVFGTIVVLRPCVADTNTTTNAEINVETNAKINAEIDAETNTDASANSNTDTDYTSIRMELSKKDASFIHKGDTIAIGFSSKDVLLLR